MINLKIAPKSSIKASTYMTPCSTCNVIELVLLHGINKCCSFRTLDNDVIDSQKQYEISMEATVHANNSASIIRNSYTMRCPPVP